MTDINETDRKVLLFLLNHGVLEKDREESDVDIRERIAEEYDGLTKNNVGSSLGKLRNYRMVLREPNTGTVEYGPHSGTGFPTSRFVWVPTGKAHKWAKQYMDELYSKMAEVDKAVRNGFVYRPEQVTDSITEREPEEVLSEHELKVSSQSEALQEG